MAEEALCCERLGADGLPSVFGGLGGGLVGGWVRVFGLVAILEDGKCKWEGRGL